MIKKNYLFFIGACGVAAQGALGYSLRPGVTTSVSTRTEWLARRVKDVRLALKKVKYKA